MDLDSRRCLDVDFDFFRFFLFFGNYLRLQLLTLTIRVLTLTSIRHDVSTRNGATVLVALVCQVVDVQLQVLVTCYQLDQEQPQPSRQSGFCLLSPRTNVVQVLPVFPFTLGLDNQPVRAVDHTGA